jgi:hypothetical protein
VKRIRGEGVSGHRVQHGLRREAESGFEARSTDVSRRHLTGGLTVCSAEAQSLQETTLATVVLPLKKRRVDLVDR